MEDGDPGDLEALRARARASLGFRDDGTLPPYLGTRAHITDPVLGGPFALSMTECCALLGFTATRRRLLGRLLDYRQALREIGIVRGEQWIGGSFVEHTNVEPHDVDVVTVAEVPERWFRRRGRGREREVFTALTTPKSAKATFGIDAYFYPTNEIRRSLPHIYRMLNLFSHTKANTWKGFVAVDLEADDVAARDALQASTIPAPAHMPVAEELQAAARRPSGSPRLVAYETAARSPFAIRPARPRPDTPWSPCLPTAIAESWGWDVTLHEACDVLWRGGAAPTDVEIGGNARVRKFVGSFFGHGIVTIRIPYILRTPAGWNLWVRGPVNAPRDAIAALEGMVETDWSIAPFSINWQITRPGQVVRFAVGDVIARLVPQPRHELERFDPVVMPVAGDKGLARRAKAWNDARRHALAEREAASGSEYRAGRFDAESTRSVDHQLRVQVRRFRRIE